jgi:cytochrome c oxidase subunit II
MSVPGWGVPALQSVLEPASPEAEHIQRLWWLFCWLSVGIWLLVVCFAALALLRRSRAPRERPLAEPGWERALVRSTGAATVLTALLLVGLLIASVSTGQTLRQLGSDPGGAALHIKVTAQRWWWQIEYPAEPVSQSVESANELHVPVGRPVLLELSSHDVIHSLWLPDLQGKRDLIPGVQTQLRFTASREGTFRGQCAEYCGVQHAHMGLLLVAESPQRFAAWLSAQRQSSQPPADERAQHGRDVFLSAQCPMCHGIRGTPAAASRGPDLTHLMSRATLAAATLPNQRVQLADWISDPQRFKPGNLMPANPLPPADLEALVAYLGGLQ